MALRTKILLAKPTQDSHDRPVRYLATKFRDAGFEVVFITFLVAEEIVRIALQEDVDVIAISTLSGGHMPVFEELLAGLQNAGLGHMVVIGGGIIPPADKKTLRNQGVAAIFGPGSSAEEAILFIRDKVGQRSVNWRSIGREEHL